MTLLAAILRELAWAAPALLAIWLVCWSNGRERKRRERLRSWKGLKR